MLKILPCAVRGQLLVLHNKVKTLYYGEVSIGHRRKAYPSLKNSLPLPKAWLTSHFARLTFQPMNNGPQGGLAVRLDGPFPNNTTISTELMTLKHLEAVYQLRSNQKTQAHANFNRKII